MDRKRMALAVGMALMAQGGMAQDIPALWREVAEAGEKDQPKTAIAALEKIYDAAVAKESWDDALAAVGQRAILDGRIEEGWNAYGAVLKMDEARQTAPEKMKPLLDALSAEWLSRYFAENIWQFRQRSEIADADEGNDIDSWSLPRILKEVDARFAKTLDRPDVFAQYPASEFKCSFEQGNMSTARADTRPPVGGVEGERPREPQEDAYRPTVYDILVWRAVQFYSQTMVKNTTDDFTVTLEMPLLGDAESFMTWAAALPPDASPNKKALRLIASVMRFHKERGNALAFADADFNRLKTVQHVLQMSDVDSDLLTSAYDKALDAFVETYADNEVSARGIAAQAMRLYNQKKYVEALALAEKGMDRFPKSVGANECYNVILRVKEPSLDFETETVWARSKPEARPNGTIRVTCRNIPKIHFRLYPTTITTNREAHYLDRRRVESIVKEQHAYAWEMLTQEDGYQEVSRPFDVEEELVAGAYILVASTREDFLYEWDKNNLFAAVVQVSDLAAEITSVSKTYRVRVVNSETGVPIENASVTANVNTRNEIQATTDAEGYCEIASTSSGIMFDIRKGDERIISPSVYWQSASPRNQQENDTRALLVTDRAIYRPGQTVRYKGIYYVANATTGVYEIRPNAEYTIRFRDPNGKEIDSRKERANSFGSFSGSFVIPADRGTGHMRLEMADRHNSSVGFRVEEYKRPKFEVVFDPLKGEIKLNDNVPMSGRAATYSGLPLDQASVRWTVTRGTSYPYWFYRASFSFPQVIASGETQTDADGTFKLNFAAEPEPGAKPGDSPVFRYAIHAEVVDATGETRSGSQAIRLGFSSVSVSLEVPKWFTPNAPRDVTVRLATLNGEPVASAGNAVVHTLRQPERPSRNAQEAQWKGYDESLSPMGWETKEAIQNVPFTTDGTGVAKLPLRLPAGCYRIEATAQDKQGNPVTDKAILMVVDPASKTYPVKIPFILLPQQYECKVGETFRALWGSGYPQAYGTLEIWADGKVLKRVLPRPDETQTLIEFEVPENLRGGFTVRSSMVREGRLWQDSTHISVPWDNKELKLNWTHINSKLEPGKQEKWTLTVQDPHAKAAHAEVAAVMYDSSLDAFNHHRWYSFGGFRFESYYGRSSFTVGDSRLSSCISISYPPSGYRPVQYPDWSTSLLPSQVRYSRDVRTLRGFGGVMRSMAAVPTPAAAKMGVAAAELVDMDGEVMAFAFDGEPDEVNDRFAAFEELELPQAEPPPVMRKNLEETAFFIPDLETDGQGTITLSFIAPEALTGWRVMAFAHDAELRYGHIETSAVTQRKLMIIPNLPRFLREGDSIGIPVKVVNTSDAPQRGGATLSLVD
ncbi:MAG: MG2 domain-containing protein, partial [Kiritimatiellaeota bacterium]|nr:MG2 domain-containing protein [Kiritimatiellota bacterium]